MQNNLIRILKFPKRLFKNNLFLTNVSLTSETILFKKDLTKNNKYKRKENQLPPAFVSSYLTTNMKSLPG